MLAAVGIFGVMTFAVEQRTREIGIRMALGAEPRQVLELILRQGIGRVVIGLASGLVLAGAMATAGRVMLYGVEPIDPVTFLGTAFILGRFGFSSAPSEVWIGSFGNRGNSAAEVSATIAKSGCCGV